MESACLVWRGSVGPPDSSLLPHSFDVLPALACVCAWLPRQPGLFLVINQTTQSVPRAAVANPAQGQAVLVRPPNSGSLDFPCYIVPATLCHHCVYSGAPLNSNLLLARLPFLPSSNRTSRSSLTPTIPAFHSSQIYSFATLILAGNSLDSHHGPGRYLVPAGVQLIFVGYDGSRRRNMGLHQEHLSSPKLAGVEL